MSKIKKISTSALSKIMTIPKYQLDEMLIACKYIEKADTGYCLTDLGKENSGEVKNMLNMVNTSYGMKI